MTSVDISVRRPDGFTIDPATTGRFFVRTIARLIDIGVGFGAGCFASVVSGVLLALLDGLRISVGHSPQSIWNLIFGSFLFAIAFATVGAICAEATSEAIAGTSVGKLMLGFRVVSLSGSDVIPCLPEAALKRSIAFLGDGILAGYFAYIAMKESPLNQRMGDAWAGTVVVRGSSLPAGAKWGLSRVLTGLIAGFAVRVLFTSLQLVIVGPARP